jgi:hypothetical protein
LTRLFEWLYSEPFTSPGGHSMRRILKLRSAFAVVIACAANAALAESKGHEKTRVVSGSLRSIFQHDDGTTEDVLDTQFVTPDTILYPDGNGGFVSQLLAIDPDGNFSVPGVPRGTYYLKSSFLFGTFSSNGFVTGTFVELAQLDADTPDLTAFIHGRANATFPTSPTQVSLNVSGLDPWAGGDSLNIVTAQSFTSRVPSNVQQPAVGATGATLSFDWTQAFDGDAENLPDAEQGDRTYFYQVHSRPLATGVDVALADRFAGPTAFTVPDGATVSTSVALQPAPLSRKTGTGAALSKFAALVPEMNPAASLTADPDSLAVPFAFNDFFSVPGPPGFPDGQVFGVAPRVHEAFFSYAAVDQDADFGTLRYGGFLDPLYKNAREFVFGAGLVATAEDGTKMGFNPGYLVVARPHSLPDVLEPELTPARRLRIQGKDAFAPQAGVGLTPTLSWNEPRKGTPSSYVVQINMISAPASDDAVIAIQTRVFNATSFTVPPGLLVAGKTYNASITAIQTDEDENRPLRTGLPIIQVDAVTNTFTP